MNEGFVLEQIDREVQVSARLGRFLEDIATSLGGLGLLVFLGFTAWQSVTWLQDGHWPHRPAISVGLVWLLEGSGESPLGGWAMDPESWIGLHRLADRMSVGGGIFLCLVVISAVFMFLAFKAQSHAEESRARYRETKERLDRRGFVS